jgi:hypothetical protein
LHDQHGAVISKDVPGRPRSRKRQFEASAFGVTNTPHFNNPTNNGSNADISRANFGAITSTLVTTNASLGGSGGQRQWWFGGKLFF